MKTLKEKLMSGAAGLALGVLSYYLINGWYNIIPWAAAAVLTGYLSNTRNSALINGAIFGYFLFLSYIVVGYRGHMDAGSLAKFGVFTVLFSLVGSAIGLVGGIGGYLIKKKGV